MSVAEVKFVASSGASVVDVLRQIKSTTKDVGAENAKILTQIRDQAKAEHEAAAAAREVAEAARRAAGEAAKAAKATREHKKEIADTQAKIDAVVDSTVSWAGALANVHANMEKIAGVKAFGEVNKEVNDLEEKLVRLGLSMDMSAEKLEALTGKKGKIIFEIAAEGGVKGADVVDALTTVQNETSMGERFMANGGAVMKNIAKFANVTGSKPSEAALAFAQYADKFQMTNEQMQDFSAGLVKQQMQGSLEAKTMPKFVPAAVPYMALSGKKGTEGALEMTAIANVIKDEGGTGGGQHGAATARTFMMAMFNTLSDPKKRGMLEKGLGAKVMGGDGIVDFVGLTASLGGMLKSDPAKFNKVMAQYVKDSSARKALTALAAGGAKNTGTDKALDKLRAPDIAGGRKSVEEGMARLAGTMNVGDTMEDQRQLAAATQTHEIMKPTIEDTHKAGGRFRVLHPQLAAMLGEGKILSALSGASQYGSQAANWVSSLGAGPGGMGARPRDDLGGTKWDAQILQSKLAQFEENDRKGSGVRLPADDLKLMRQELSLLLTDIKAMEKGKGEGVTVNNNIQISAPGVEARVTQEAQPTPNKAQNGSKPAAARGAGVR